MLYSKDKHQPKQRSYAYLHVHTSSKQLQFNPHKERVMLNGKPKQLK